MEVIEELGRGADFADLATSESADNSKARGGDSGWIRPGASRQGYSRRLNPSNLVTTRSVRSTRHTAGT